MVEELHTREQKTREQVRELKQDKQRLEDTIYRLKTEAMAINVSQQKVKEDLAKERETMVRRESCDCVVDLCECSAPNMRASLYSKYFLKGYEDTPLVKGIVYGPS